MITWVPITFVALGAVVAGTAVLIGTNSIVGATSLFTGLFTMVVAGVLLIAMRPFVGPQGRILRSHAGGQVEQIEIRRIHPAFVAAVNQQHIVRPAP